MVKTRRLVTGARVLTLGLRHGGAEGCMSLTYVVRTLGKMLSNRPPLGLVPLPFSNTVPDGNFDQREASDHVM